MSGLGPSNSGLAPREGPGSSTKLSSLSSQHAEGLNPFHSHEQTLATASLRSMSPMISRRAWQIQADEGVAPVQYRPTSVRVEGSANVEASERDGVKPKLAVPARMLDTQDDPPVFSSSSRSQQGRARAGTLPSSWNNSPSGDSFSAGDGSRSKTGNVSVQGIGITPIGGDFSPWTNAPRPSDPWSGLTNSVPGTPSESHSLSYLSSFLPATSTVHRNTVGNAARPSSALLNYLSVPSDDSTYNTASASSQTSLNLLHANNLSPLGSMPTSSYDRPAPQAAFTDLRSRSGSMNTSASNHGMGAFGSPLGSSAWADRAIGLAGSGRNSPASRRSSILATGSLTSYGENQPGGASAELSSIPSRLQQQESIPLSEYGRTDGADYEALSMSDAKVAGAMRPEFGLANQRTRASTLAAMPHGSLARTRSNQDVGSLNASHSASGGANMDSRSRNYSNDGSTDAAASAFNVGRLRSGTVAALGGPGGRQRAERELLRMASAGKFSHLSGQEMSALLSSLESMGVSNGLVGDANVRNTLYSGAPLEGFPYLDVSTPPSLSNRHSPVPTPQPSNHGELTPDMRNVVPHQQSSGLARQPSSSNLQGLGVSSAVRDAPSVLNQTPSRSLWIGNLRASVTGQELMHVFAQYGAIESLRLLPDRECGFVNFVEIEDAIRARDDVLVRLSGRLESLGNGAGGVVRIGFGKVEHGHGASSSQANFATTASNRTTLAGAFPSVGRQVDDEGLLQGLGLPSMSDGSPPTRALWVGSIPANVTPATLMSIFQPFGPVESARVLTHKNCGFVNFERIDDAVRARKMLNGREVLGSEVGAMRIGFAKVPTRTNEQGIGAVTEGERGVDPASTSQRSRAAEDNFARTGAGIENSRSNLAIKLLNGQHQNALARQQVGPVDAPAPSIGLSTSSQKAALPAQPGRQSGLSSSSSIVPASDKGGVPLPAHMAPRADVNDWQLLMRELSQDDDDSDADVASMTQLRPMQTYYTTVPLVTDISSGRRFETAKLRETRRGIESGQYSKQQCDQLVVEYLDSIVDLASDYIGNTLVQKFFESCSEQMRTEMLQRLAPHLAMIGCHKNGTWAAQKILDCTDNAEHVKLIAQHLRPYIPGLLLDSFGNYVVQCCLRWSNYNDFVFDAMVDRCWEIAQGRFGARSMRACLENGNVSQRQRKRVAIAVILNSVPLATSPNGSILLTWLLETSGLSRSYRLLAPRLSPHLAHLCTHKLASNTVLRIVTQKVEPTASQMILSALFDNEAQDPTLEDIVIDQVHGSQFVTKVLASPILTTSQRDGYSLRIRALLIKNNLVGVPAYRRLCEDLGLLATSNDDPTDGFVGAGSMPSSDLVGGTLPSLPNNVGLPPNMTDPRFATPPNQLPAFPTSLPQGPGWRPQ